MPTLTRRDFNLMTLSSAFLLSACKKSVPTDAFRIGVLLPTSGYQAAIGQSCKRGAQIAPEIMANLGVNVELVYADTESNVNTGRTKAEKLINDGVHAIVGAYDSGVTTAVAQVCEQRRIPFIINIAAAPKITEQGYKYVFRNFLTGPMLVKNGLMLMKELFAEKKISPKKAAFIHVNDTYGESMRAGIEALLPQLNMPFELVAKPAYDPKTQDLSTEIATIKNAGADFIMPATRLEDAVLLVKEIIKQKLNIMGIINPGSPGMYEQEFYDQLKDNSNHWISNTVWYNPKAPLCIQALDVFNKKFPKNIFETNVAFTFEAIHIACDAYKRANSKSSDDLRIALAQTSIEDHVTLGGPIEFDATGQSKNIQSASMQNHDRRPKIIYPLNIRETEPIFPIPSYVG